jgi:hypothetical protein
MAAFLQLALLSAAAGCVPPDCHRPDCGTCSVACCVLLVEVATAEVQLMQALNGSLAKGGPDGRFFLKPTAESPCGEALCPVPAAPPLVHVPPGLHPAGFGDLRPFHPEAVSFIGQAYHATLKRIYNDTLNFLIYAPKPDLPNASRMQVHSISQIGGAYCDDGQNYKNIAVLLKSLGFAYREVQSTGCPLKGRGKAHVEL